MPDSVAGLVGAVFIIGLLTIYFVQRRAATRAPEPEPPAEASEAGEEVAYSINLGVPAVYLFLLIASATHKGNFWGYLWESIYLLLVAAALYFTLSPAQLAAEQRRVPGTTRSHYYLRTGVPYVVLPAVGWLICWAFF